MFEVITHCFSLEDSHSQLFPDSGGGSLLDSNTPRGKAQEGRMGIPHSKWSVFGRGTMQHKKKRIKETLRGKMSRNRQRVKRAGVRVIS